MRRGFLHRPSDCDHWGVGVNRHKPDANTWQWRIIVMFNSPASGRKPHMQRGCGDLCCNSSSYTQCAGRAGQGLRALFDGVLCLLRGSGFSSVVAFSPAQLRFERSRDPMTTLADPLCWSHTRNMTGSDPQADSDCRNFGTVSLRRSHCYCCEDILGTTVFHMSR